MCSSAVWPSGSRTRWAGSHGSRFIAAQRAQFGIPHASACRALGVSPAWLCKWLHGDGSLRRARRQALTTLVIALFHRRKGRYGWPRISDDLRAMGWKVSVNTIVGIMAEQHLVARPKRHRRNPDGAGQVRAEGAGPAQPGLQPAGTAGRGVGR